MTQQELIEKIKSKIIVACPEITTRNISVKISAPFSGLVNYKDDGIGIAEILRTASRTCRELGITQDGIINWGNGKIPEIILFWNLTKDRLEEQSIETLMFLWELLK